MCSVTLLYNKDEILKLHEFIVEQLFCSVKYVFKYYNVHYSL